MKKIIPFNNVVDFKTDVREITAISLEHEIKKYPDMISGVFYISGEYKITEGLLEKEKFNFELPFDIALTNNYDLDSLLVDIDDFRYDLITDKSLKVNIDLYIDGEEIEPPIERNIYTEELVIKDEDVRDTYEDNVLNNEDTEKEIISKELKEDKPIIEESIIKEMKEIEIQKDIDELDDELTCIEETDEIIEPERIDLLKDMLTNNKVNEVNKENEMNENTNLNINNNINDDSNNVDTNVFMPTQEEEKYVTYRVYKVLENDTLDTILTKYNVTKEMLSDYNNIENITTGDKLIIPTINTNEK